MIIFVILSVINFRYAEALLQHYFSNDKSEFRINIITPSDIKQRGCQLSLMFSCPVDEVCCIVLSAVVTSPTQNFVLISKHTFFTCQTAPHLRDVEENKSASLLVVSLGKALNESLLP